MYGRRGDVVPLEVAQRIHAERDAALAQLDRARADVAQLRRALEQREAERARLTAAARSLEADLAKAHAECDDLRERLAAAEAEAQARHATHAEAESRVGDVHRSEPDGARVQELLGDLANLRRRRDLDLDAGRKAEQARLLARLADVRDTVLWGLASAPDPSSPWYAGLVGIRDQIDAQLAAENASLFGRVGDPFDPRIHDGVGTLRVADLPSGVVAKVESPGLRLDDGTLVRPARVRVAE